MTELDDAFSFIPSGYINVHVGDCRQVLPTFPDRKYDSCITSPPYFNQRDYGVDGQLGLEETPEQYIDNLVAVFSEVWRVLKDDGTFWLNIGDGYANEAYPGLSIKPRDLMAIPWRVALRLQQEGWYLRQDIIFEKLDPMPEPARNRCAKSHEYLFLLTKQPDYYFDSEAIRERGVSGRKGVSPQKDTRTTHGAQSGGNGGINQAKINMLKEFEANGFVTRNKRSVWTMSVQQDGVRNLHFATFPPDLVRPCILAGSREDGWVLDPFGGSGTVGMVAREVGRRADLIELNPEYAKLANERCW